MRASPASIAAGHCLVAVALLGLLCPQKSFGGGSLGKLSPGVAEELFEHASDVADSSLRLRQEHRRDDTIPMYDEEFFQRFDRDGWARILTGHEVIVGAPVSWVLERIDLRIWPGGSVYAIILYFDVVSERGSALEAFSFGVGRPLIGGHTVWPKPITP